MRRGICVSTYILTTQSTLARPQVCKPSGKVRGKKLPPEIRNDCCEKGKLYNTYKCSPPVSKSTKAILTLNSFETIGDVPSTCDHTDCCTLDGVVQWRAKTTVIDECDSIMGCDADNGHQPPRGNNIVEASKAIWEALGVPKDDWNVLIITWSDV
ncbi:kiwellin-1-like [Primulina tabacum]|uniref:kiwellin-1-like n=1 Tax=Primulina tabacum TaxID=48773 RepID=UPI003F5963B3